MNRTMRILSGSIGVAALALVPSVPAQNLLADNAGFEANTAYYTPGWGWPQGAPDVLPGWVITLDTNGDGYAGAATNQSPQDLEGTHFGYIYSGTGAAALLETAPASRAPIDAGTTYTLWFLARGDSPWGEALATVSLIWYPNQSNDSPKGEDAMDVTLPVRLSTEDPMQTFHITAVAPQGAHYAGMRVTRPTNDYNPLLLDDFVIMAEPVQVSLSIKKGGPRALLSWPRELKHDLQENSNPALTGEWHKVNKPVKGSGATNYVDYPLTNNVRFFRLAPPN
jgi:hypothetical protein